MPLILKSTKEARYHLKETSAKALDKIKAFKGTLSKSSSSSEPIKKLGAIFTETLDDRHTQHYSAWLAISTTEATV